MTARHIPLPTSAKESVEVKSLSNPDYLFILKPATEHVRAKVRLNNREANGYLDPIRAKMREIMLKHNFGAHFDTQECERVQIMIEEVQSGLLDMSGDDIQLYGQAESICIAENIEFKRLCLQEEMISEDQTLRQMAYMLDAVIINGERHDWPGDDLGIERFKFLQELGNEASRELEHLKMEAANLLRPTPVTEKNSEPPSGSGSDPIPSSGGDSP